MIVLVDQDDVLNHFNETFNEIWKLQCPPELYVPPSQQEIFYLPENYPSHLQSAIRNISEGPGWILNLPPVEDGIKAVHEMLAMGIDVRICTAPLRNYDNCVLEKYRWIERYLGREFVERTILTRDKTLIQGSFLIDDKPEIIGSAVPTWEHILYNQPYNQNSKVKKRLYHWNNWKALIGI